MNADQTITTAFRDLYSQVQKTSHNTPLVAAMTYIAGVFCDVKPAAFCDLTEPDLANFDTKSFRASLEPLGISVEFETARHAGHPYLRWYISKDPAKIARLRALESRRSFADDIVRETGALLGYPPTATEYFIKRLHMESPPVSDLSLDTGYHLDGYIHDPAHLEEECAAYERPIAECLAKYCPTALQNYG